MERPPDPPDFLVHAGFLKALARGLLRDEHRAEDVVQESFAAALVAGERRDWRAWLGAVAKNLSAKVRRGERRREARERRVARTEALPSAADLAAQLELHQRLVAAVSHLDEPYRSAVLLRYFHGLDVAEIARREGVPPGTVRARLSRALAMLRARLDRERAGWTAVLLPLLDRKALGGAFMAANKKVVVLVALVLALGSATLVWRASGTRAAPVPRAETPAVAMGEGSVEPAGTIVAQVPAAAEDPAPRLRGTVLGPDGLPVAGARVLAYPEDSTSVVFADAEKPGVESAASDDAGRFALLLADPARGWTLHVTAEGCAPAIREPVLAGDDVMIRLDALATLRGHVRNMEGEPVAGATVRWLGFFAGAAIVRETRSATDGAYAIAVPPPKGAFSALPGAGGVLVEARAEGYAPLLVEADMWGAPVPDRLELDLIVLRGATVRGRVVDWETNDPVAGARVVLWSTEGRLVVGRHRSKVENPFVLRALGETVADAQGAFAFDHVPAHGFHPLLVSYGGGKSACVGASADGYVRGGSGIDAPLDGATVETEIRLALAGYVRGRVIDATKGPVEGARVWASGPWASVPWPALYGEPFHVAETDGEGRYPARAVGAMRDGTGVTRIMTEGAHVDVHVRPGETVEAPDLVRGRDAPEEGIDVLVVDGSGAPVGDAYLWTDRFAASASTDERGRAVLRVPGGSTVTLTVEARGFGPAFSEPVLVPASGLVPLRIVVEQGLRLRGRVVWEDGTPAEGALVFVLDGRMPLGDARSTSRAHFAMTESGPDGSFATIDLPRAACHVFAILHRAVGPTKPQASVTVALPGTSDVIVTLPGKYVPPSGVLEGVVVDASTGKSPPALRVTVGDSYARVYSPGRFRYERLAPGKYPVLVEAPGYASRDMLVEVGDGAVSVRVDLEQGGAVSGRITDESGLLSSGFVTLVPEGPAIWRIPSARIAGDGSYRIEPLGPGTYHPLVTANGHLLLAAKGYEPIVVRAGRDANVDFTVVRGGELNVGVGFTTRPAPEDLASLRVTVEGEGVRRAWSRTFEVLMLPPGRYALRLHIRDRVVREAAVEVKAGERAETEIKAP